ncbi:FAD binding domain-containing protein [Pseudomonas sp. GD03842]|uniref:FAD binding domain-containing protein n=1 Tax=Pseudomonas sp. GD03842 TaxID=2975385 RepID=UPI00244D0CFC|nr:FAD binding domain-containing protein [Pseudomonas sp. GD03842]MDH0745173.1 FAD binding domain-containing protein [Pseudomonas sp. GD03842]
MKSIAFDYQLPPTAADAVRLLKAGDGMGKVVAGSQSLGPMMNLRLVQPEQLVDVRRLPELNQVQDLADSVVLGAATTHAAIEDGRVPDASAGLMPFVARGIAYRAVRNRGTLGGSLAHADPAADWVNVMALLDADIMLLGPEGERTVKADGFMLGAFTTHLAEDELIRAVRIPKVSSAARWSYYKFNRKTGEFAEAIAAFMDDPARGVRRAIIGAVDGPPLVIEQAGALIDGWDDELAKPWLLAAGIEADSYDYHTHLVALRRAAQQLSRLPGASL